MISKKIECEPENDNFARLADYITGGNHTNEKVFTLWTASCWAGDDYAWAKKEIVDTQSLNNRATQTKTYHLVVSFRPEDEVKLTPEAFKDIETHFAKAMKLEEHQRVCGVHKDTDNMHMHVAYNLIHPDKLTIHTPFQDYIARDKVCREMELKYGISIDNGISAEFNPQKITDSAAKVEAQSGEQSFERYAKKYRVSILKNLKNITSWQDIHVLMGQFNMTIKPRGNGLIIEDKGGKARIKASTLDRSLSLSKMVALFGEYIPYTGKNIEPMDQYQKTPIQIGRKVKEYYGKYQKVMANSWKKYEMLEQEEYLALNFIQNKWKEERLAIACKPISRRIRYKLLAIAKQKEKDEVQPIRDAFQRERLLLKKEKPFHSWCDFLTQKAVQGDETALAILRSKKMVMNPEKPTLSERELIKRQEYYTQVREKEKDIKNLGLRSKYQQSLIAIQRMKKALFPHEQTFSYRIDKKGVVIYTLASGGTVRDSGKNIHFSSHDEIATQVALKYAQAKWGKNIDQEGNQIKFVQRQRQQGNLR